MGLETNPQWLADLNRLWPLGTDQKRYGDNNIRNLKLALQNSFGGFAAGVWVTGTDGGAVNAYTVNPSVLPPALGAKMTVVFSPVATNTGACTLNYAGLGVKAIKSVVGADLTANDLVVGSIYAAFYNGTEYRLLSVTKNYADQLAFSAALPAQPGDAVRRVLQTLSGVASWVLITWTRSGRTSNTILGIADNHTFIDITSGTFTQTFSAAATLTNGWTVRIRNSGTGDITIPDSDGRTNWIMYPSEVRDFYCDGAAFYSTPVTPFMREYTANGTFIKPPGYSRVMYDLTGGGAGGGGGQGLAAANIRLGGTGGGGGGRNIETVLASLVSNSTAITIGANGTGGAGGTAGNGSNGTAGGNTLFGTIAAAYGGGYGVGGQAATISGGGGGGRVNAGINGASGTSGVGASDPVILVSNSGNNAFSGGAGGAGGNLNTPVVTGCAEYGGAGGGFNVASGINASAGGASLFGGCGGGAGGSITAANAGIGGGNGGLLGAYVTAGGGAGGAGSAGAAGTAGVATGAGGGGGASNTAGTGGAGAVGGNYGDGGGGGGAGTNVGGAGGAGKPGRAIIGGIL